MIANELKRMALCMLVDYDARTRCRPFTHYFDMTSLQAYELQGEIARLREQRGEKIIGYKIGCISKPIQEQLGVDEPIFGRIFDTGCFPSGARLSHARFANLAVEGEMAVRLGEDLSGAAVSEQAHREAIEAVFPVIELHHHVVPETWPPGQWLIASNGMHAGFVRAEAETGSMGLASIAHRLTIRINEAVVGEDSDSLTRPIQSLRWLAGRLAHFGLQLRKGQVILTGSPMKLFPVAPDSRIVVEAPPLGASYVEITS